MRKLNKHNLNNLNKFYNELILIGDKENQDFALYYTVLSRRARRLQVLQVPVTVRLYVMGLKAGYRLVSMNASKCSSVTVLTRPQDVQTRWHCGWLVFSS